VGRILTQGFGFIDTRKVWGILSLDKSYPREQVNKACREALELDSLTYRTVRGLLKIVHTPETSASPNSDDSQDSDPRTITNTREHKFVRPLSVYEDQVGITQPQSILHHSMSH
jgi:hypothetical protein